MPPKPSECIECGQPTDDPSGICIECQEEIAAEGDDPEFDVEGDGSEEQEEYDDE